MNIEKRLKLYRRYLSKDRNHYSALLECINTHSFTIENKLFLHTYVPILVNYVEWVLDNAINSKLGRLYFLARDGYLLYDIANRIVTEQNINIECKYLKVSRYAVRSAQYHLLKEKSLELICAAGIDMTFHKIMKRASLTEEEISDIAESCGYEHRVHTILSKRQIAELKSKLYNVPRLFEYIEMHAGETYPLVMAYLQQEGLMADSDYALVDSGWIGSLQQSIEDIVKSVNRDIQFTGFYFGLYSVPDNAERNRYHTYYFSPERGLTKKVLFSNCLFEALVSSPEGMTIGYRKEEKIIPIDNCPGNPNAQQIICQDELLKLYLDGYLKNQWKYQRLKSCKRLLAKCMGYPSIDEVKCFGTYQFCDDLIDNYGNEVAVNLSQQDIKAQRVVRKILRYVGISKRIISESAWIEGSIVRNQKTVRLNLGYIRISKMFTYIRKAFKR